MGRHNFWAIPSTLATAVALVGNPLTAQAQGSIDALLEEVVVTARKRSESSQDVPLSISAFSSEQIESLKLQNLTDLSVRLPNVALDDLGTTRGTANFSIRGLGVNSSIPSIDPTVGLFIDGVYMGVNNGVILETFDLESIEVLRGPQGILFGRNVTGGAVLINTRKPSEEFELEAKASVDGGGDGGLNQAIMGSISGPISDTLSARLTVHHRDDEGYFENEFDGEDFGGGRSTIVRPTIQWNPSDDFNMILRYQYSDSDGDGPVAQTHTNGSGVPGSFANFDRDSHDFSIDEPGFARGESHFVSFETNWHVGENGTITNVFGYRESTGESLGDIDAQPVWLFHAPSWLDTEQFSNELRFTTTIADKANITTGVYYYTNELNYHERRELLGIATGNVAPAAQFDGGGNYNVETYGVFGAIDYDLNDEWTLTAGLRYTYEEKEAEVASLSANINNPCNIVEPSVSEPACAFDFVDSDDWSSLSPKLGVTWNLQENANLYAHWTRGFRSGGYNLRNTSFNPADTPGPFDEEQVDNYEVGFKATFPRGRLNAALFYNEIEDMQREINLPSQGAGTIQLVRNTADATILGLEIDGTYALTDSLLMIASVGWLDPEYDDVFFDLNGDGVINSADEDLDLPRAAELTYTIGLNHDLELGSWGYLSSRISFSYRDESAYTDNNLGYLLEQERLDAGVDLRTNDGRWIFSLYGRNLSDEVLHGGDTQLPNDIGGVPVGGTFSPLAKGRVIGAEITFNL